MAEKPGSDIPYKKIIHRKYIIELREISLQPEYNIPPRTVLKLGKELGQGVGVEGHLILSIIFCYSNKDDQLTHGRVTKMCKAILLNGPYHLGSFCDWMAAFSTS